MSENITVNMENLSNEEREQLLKLVEKANKPANKIWKPKPDEIYFFINYTGQVAKTSNNLGLVFQNRYNLNNCFRTEREAADELKRLEILAYLKRLSIESGEQDNPWDGDHYHWFVYYDCVKNDLLYDWNTAIKGMNIIYFSAKEALYNAVKEIGEDNIKKYIFGVRINDD